jgi:hypothetical protein
MGRLDVGDAAEDLLHGSQRATRRPPRPVAWSAAEIVRRLGFTLVGTGERRQLHHHRVHRVGTFPAPFEQLHRTYPATFTVELERTTTPCGFSYARGGWHPYAAALEEHLADPELPYERSVLARYYRQFQPTSVQEALLEDVAGPLPPLDAWPPVPKLYKHLWTLNPRRVRAILRGSDDWAANIKQHLGPQTAEQARAHLARIVGVHDSVRERGYQPDAYPDGVVTGYFLEAEGDYRFMVILGNHRLAAFRAAGVERISARLHPGHPPVINARRLEQWSRRSGRVLPTSVATSVFEKLFTETGTDKARTLGII